MNSRKKVAFLLSCLKFGGAERVALNLAKALQVRHDVDIDIVLMSREGEFLDEAEASFNVVDLKCDRTYKLPLKLGLYALKARPNAIISSFWKLNFSACLTKAAMPIFKLLLWEHSTEYQKAFGLGRIYFFVISNTFYRFADYIVAVSSGVFDDIAQHTLLLRSKLNKIYNPVTPPDPLLVCAREPNLERANEKRLIYVGRLAPEKNPILVVNAFALASRTRKMTLTFVGDGPLRRELEHLIEQRQLGDLVRCVGFQKNPYEYVSKADILVISSLREGLPSAIIEALYCGCSIVSTDCGGGIRDILGNGCYGTIVPRNDENALAQGILDEIETNRDFERQISAAQRFLPETAADAYYELIFSQRPPFNAEKSFEAQP